MKFNIKKRITLLMCFLLIFAQSVNAFATPYSAPDHTLTFTLQNGGSWGFSGAYADKTKSWSPNDWRSAQMIQRVDFISPEQVQKTQDLLAKDIGFSMMLEGVKFTVETGLSVGSAYATQWVIQKYGASLGTAFGKYVSAFGWAYTAYDVLSTMVNGADLYRYTQASILGKGLIHETGRGLGNISIWYYWDGSSSFGNYPNAKLGPNDWQFGYVTIL